MTPQQAFDKLLFIQHIANVEERFTYKTKNNSVATIEFGNDTWIHPETLRKLMKAFPEIYISETRIFIWLV